MQQTLYVQKQNDIQSCPTIIIVSLYFNVAPISATVRLSSSAYFEHLHGIQSQWARKTV